MATLTKTLKLPFLRLNRSQAALFERLQKLNTDVANSILAMPKEQRRALTPTLTPKGRQAACGQEIGVERAAHGYAHQPLHQQSVGGAGDSP